MRRKFSMAFDEKIMVCGDTTNTIFDQKELESLGMYIQESIYFENGVAVYKGYISKFNKNKSAIYEKYAKVMLKK